MTFLQIARLPVAFIAICKTSQTTMLTCPKASRGQISDKAPGGSAFVSKTFKGGNSVTILLLEAYMFYKYALRSERLSVPSHSYKYALSSLFCKRLYEPYTPKNLYQVGNVFNAQKARIVRGARLGGLGDQLPCLNGG
jgi:hypothetical protein